MTTNTGQTLTSTTLRHLCAALWDSWSQPVVIQPGIEPGSVLTPLRPLCHLGMTLQAWHTCIWGISPILLCRSSQALSVKMGNVTAQLFSAISRDVRSGSSPGSGWAIQGYSKTCPEATPALFGCVLMVIVLLQNFLGTLPHMRPRHNPVTELYGQFLRPHGFVFALTRTVNCGTFNRQVCTFPKHVQSIQIYHRWTPIKL